MARRVFVHIGLPKTATTYLQTIMWAQRGLMREQGVLLPGRERRDHLWASRTIRQDPHLAEYDEKVRTAWDRIREEVAAWEGDALISHEFFCSASAEQAEGMLAALAPAEVHLVVTAREPLGLFSSSWQESMKNRDSRHLADYSTEVSPITTSVWNWRSLDLGLVLQRWAPTLPPDRVHVLPLSRAKAPREEIWHRFATLIGLDPESFDLSGSFPNSSMGVVEAETLRRINERLYARGLFDKPFERGVFIRTYLADERLVPRGGERFWPSPTQVADARERGRAAHALVLSEKYDVVGDVDDLLVPDELPERRDAGSVSDAEVAGVAVDLVAEIMADVQSMRRELRRTRRERDRARAEIPPPPPPPLWRRVGSRGKRAARRLLGR